MRINLKDGTKIEVTVIKNKNNYEYYLGNTKIGVYNPKVMEDHILFLQNTLDNEISAEIKDEINSIDVNEIDQDSKENERIREYIKENNIKQVKDVRKVELEEKDKDKKNIKEDTKKEKDIITKKDINIKQEVSLDERANDRLNLRNWLGGNIPSEIKSIGVIESDDMHEMKDENGKSYKNASTRYSLITINKNGEVEPLQKYIPSLRQRDSAGSNPMAQKYQVDKNGDVEKDTILSEYEIGSKVIQLDNKNMGRVQLNIGQEEHGGNETLGMQVRDSNSVWAIDTETRRVMGEYESNGYYTVDENLKEVKQHEKENSNCKQLKVEDIDGDLTTKSHEHPENKVNNIEEKIDYRKLAIKWGYHYDDGKPNEEKAKEVFQSKRKQNPEKSIDELIEEITEELELEMYGSKGRAI